MQENQKGALIALQLLIQRITQTSALWVEPLHTSGLFPYLLNSLIENEVRKVNSSFRQTGHS